ncbi:putative deoxyribonuclease TATDN2 [Haliotis rubra]|uniref:putative deoxyribonuclease TATDN2 n=1 Tax=Haliotis rubra TaxID=36100 RepID=UPI001EE50B09|nr:putative deoxyribonuclease TATDN2 [Haliotis rubra]
MRIPPPSQSVQQRHKPPTLEGLPRGFDTHFHPDRMRSRLHLDAATPLDEVLDQAGQPLDESSFDLVRAVQVFCDPPTWPQDPTFHQCWKIAVGLHPENVSSHRSNQLDKLQSLLSSPNVIALGEVGLDFTAGNWEQQGKVLEKLFKVADTNKPIILHLRGTAEDRYQRAPLEECIKIAHAAGIQPNQKFHLHCFSGSCKEMALWTKNFPETWFGYIGMVASFDEHQLSAVRFLNAKRFVLETDAPLPMASPRSPRD